MPASDPEIPGQPEPRAGVCNKKIAVQNFYGTSVSPGHFMNSPTLWLTIFSFYAFLYEDPGSFYPNQPIKKENTNRP